MSAIPEEELNPGPDPNGVAAKSAMSVRPSASSENPDVGMLTENHPPGTEEEFPALNKGTVPPLVNGRYSKRRRPPDSGSSGGEKETPGEKTSSPTQTAGHQQPMATPKPLSFRDMVSKTGPHVIVEPEPEEKAGIDEDISVDFTSSVADVRIKTRFYDLIANDWKDVVVVKPMDTSLSHAGEGALYGPWMQVPQRARKSMGCREHNVMDGGPAPYNYANRFHSLNSSEDVNTGTDVSLGTGVDSGDHRLKGTTPSVEPKEWRRAGGSKGKTNAHGRSQTATRNLAEGVFKATPMDKGKGVDGGFEKGDRGHVVDRSESSRIGTEGREKRASVSIPSSISVGSGLDTNKHRVVQIVDDHPMEFSQELVEGPVEELDDMLEDNVSTPAGRPRPWPEEVDLQRRGLVPPSGFDDEDMHTMAMEGQERS
ncbi:5-methylcytosine-specific restriction enzyme B [Striga asiatica]|uniref:5-methylcytosine-specific restriction enzyme B n=1 Tax=Striga asiatica TaxID=4170 RepID=A0A5A7QJH1_STRAF|nr:5-methylcytosine-specific restriction enzyme B [Striga asiatica]